MGRLELVQPISETFLAEYHPMRKRMLYDPVRRLCDGNYPRILLREGELIGTFQINIATPDSAFRLVAIREELQPCEYGQRLVELSESFVRKSGCCRVVVTAGDQSVSFWENCGFTSASDEGRISMVKELSVFQKRMDIDGNMHPSRQI
jgi:N-acetylglutamate synthase-like GNAT family acetyltransferase